MKGRLGQVGLSPDALCSVCSTPETGIRFQYLLSQYRSRLRNCLVFISSGVRKWGSP